MGIFGNLFGKEIVPYDELAREIISQAGNLSDECCSAFRLHYSYLSSHKQYCLVFCECLLTATSLALSCVIAKHQMSGRQGDKALINLINSLASQLKTYTEGEIFNDIEGRLTFKFYVETYTAVSTGNQKLTIAEDLEHAIDEYMSDFLSSYIMLKECNSVKLHAYFSYKIFQWFELSLAPTEKSLQISKTKFSGLLASHHRDFVSKVLLTFDETLNR